MADHGPAAPAPSAPRTYRYYDLLLGGFVAILLCSNLIGAGNTNAAAMAHILPDIAAEPAIFPPPETLSRLEMLRDFDPKLRRTLSRMWTEIKVR